MSYFVQAGMDGDGKTSAPRPVSYTHLNTYKGKITYKNVAQSFGMEYTDVRSLMCQA